jgi:iron complex outermembrane receptor protein
MKLFFSVILFLILAVTSYGQYTIDSALYLNEVVINASRTKIFTGTGRKVDIIDKTIIEETSVRSIGDILDNVPGLDARQRGTDGVQTDLSIRGGSFDQVMVMLNGINITDPQTGHHNLNIPLDLTDVSRIEILQGSAARLYGTNAFSGAINILTGENSKNELSIRNSIGSYGFISRNISGNYNSGTYQTFISVSQKESDGYIGNTDFDISSLFMQSKYRTKKSGTFNLQLSSQIKAFGANSFYSSLYPDQFENTKTFFSSVGWNRKLNNLELNLHTYWRKHYDRFELFRDLVGAERYTWYKDHNYHMTDVSGGKFSLTNNWVAGTTTIGVELRNEHIYSNVLGKDMDYEVAVPFEKNKNFSKEDNRLLSTLYFDHRLQKTRINASAGAGLTYTEQFGILYNSGIDIGFEITDPSRIFVALNSAVRLPTFTDLYYQSATQISNPDLQPEKSVTLELGYELEPDNWSFSATTFYRIGQNIIDWVKIPEAVKWESRNWTGINTFGAELLISYQPLFSPIKSVLLSYSFLDMDKESGGLDSKYALDYQKNKINLEIRHTIISTLSANWTFTYIDRSGDYSDFLTNERITYSPYILINTRFSWERTEFTVFSDINNVLNQHYSDFGGLEQPGINFNLGIKIKITGN